MSETKVFTDVSRERLNRFRRELTQWGVTVPDGDDVQVTGPFGVILRATYEDAAEKLSLSIVEKPMLIPESQVWKFVDNAAAKLKT
ncbi:MAG TPA: hypothetical protein PLL77_04730 [Pyrinomonadaceae bacterium]|nr:hypothetical protein [Pyrinomonadaceae bacterium]